MKTAHNWFADNCRADINGEVHWCVSEKDICSIQKDALMEAARVVHAMSRGTYSEERAIAIDNAVTAIIERARELIPHDTCI